MSTLELVLNMLTEATTTEISKTVKPIALKENIKAAKNGGSAAGNVGEDIYNHILL